MDNKKVEHIIDILDPSKVKCYQCLTWVEISNCVTVLGDNGKDVPICSECAYENSNKKDDWPPEANARLCHVCEEFKILDSDWDEDLIFIIEDQKIKDYLKELEIDWFCEGCLNRIKEEAEEYANESSSENN